MINFTRRKFKELPNTMECVTYNEIIQQPELWLETLQIMQSKSDKIKEFLQNLKQQNKNIRIIFTGAGSSNFVGDCVKPYLNKKLKNYNVESIATTDIVTNPDYYLDQDKPTLLISCARSGNSPESIAVVELAEKIVRDLYQIVITCNSSGNLARRATNNDKTLLLLMPPAANDQGFAMTGSFTTMVLASLLLFQIDNAEKNEKYVAPIVKLGNDVLENKMQHIWDIASGEFNRIIFLGSGSLTGLAEEAALKVMELTRGKIMTNADSSLGFRHGPKSVINDKTLLVSFLSSNKYTRKYEEDLLEEIVLDPGKKRILVISDQYDKNIATKIDYYITTFHNEISFEDDVYLVFSYLLVAQLFALFKSVQLHINPDNPSPDGTVNRVVKGVKIYPYRD